MSRLGLAAVALGLVAGGCWSDTESGLPGGFGGRSLAASGNALYVAGYGGGVYKSNAAGDRWSPTALALPAGDAPAEVAVEGQTVLVGTDGGRVFRSTDGGARFSASTVVGASAVAQTYGLALSGRAAYLATLDGVFCSADAGQRFVDCTPPETATRSVDAVTVTAERAYIAVQQSGVYSRGHGDAAWTPIGRGGPRMANSLAVVGQFLWANDVEAGGVLKVLALGDAGGAWAARPTPREGGHVTGVLAAAGRVFVSMDSDERGLNGQDWVDVLVAPAGGGAFESVDSGLSKQSVASMAVFAGRVYATGAWGVSRARFE